MQRRMRAGETAMIVYAPPGTTDRPTGCRLSHEGLVRSARVLGEQRFPMTEEDRQFNPLPLSGLGALQPFNGCLAVGAAFVGMERFNAQDALALLMDERCTVAFPAVDRLWASVLDQPDLDEADLSELWLVAVDGDAELLAAIAEVTPEVTQVSVYGSTEAGGLIALSHLDDPLELRIDSAGRPFGGIELKIVDPETGAELERRRAGRDRHPRLVALPGLPEGRGRLRRRRLPAHGRPRLARRERPALSPHVRTGTANAGRMSPRSASRTRSGSTPSAAAPRPARQAAASIAPTGGSPSTAATGSGRACGCGSDSMRAKPARSA